MANYHVIAYYCLLPLENPQEEMVRQRDFLQQKDATGRMYISDEGINGQLCLEENDASSYIQWMNERFPPIDFKIHHYHEHAFPRLTIKVRVQLVAMDEKVDLSYRGEHVEASRWKEMLQNKDENTLLLDVRNDYEWEVGHFDGAELPDLESFRQFPTYAKQLKETHSTEDTKIMMYCTGGIRCEFFSALLKKEGFKNIFQLEGGIIKYGLEEGGEHWKGKLFVFDDRLTVPVSDECEDISKCRHCQTSSDVYYNCANMDCNELFLSCPSCAETFQGCCCEECQKAPRLRPYEKGERPKPFRRWYHYESDRQ